MNKPLNIIYFGNNPFPIGAATTKRRRYMLDYMNGHHIECHVLVTWHSGKSENANDGMYGNCDYHDISHLFHLSSIRNYYKEGKHWLWEWFNADKKNVLICGTVVEFVDYPLFTFAKKIGYKIVMDKVETNYLQMSKHLPIKFRIHAGLNESIHGKVDNNTDGCFVISNALYDENHSAYPKMPLCILPNATPILQKQPKKKLSDIPVVLYTGTFAPKDGVEYLIKGFLLARKRGVNCKLVLTGKGNDFDMKVLDLIKGNPNVEYKGRVPDEELNRILLDSDILTMTRINSRFANYGFPFKLSESLATGNPVIASDVSDVTKYVRHKESAYVVRPESVEDIADGIQFYVEHPEDALRIGQNGLAVAKEKFGIDNVGRILVNFLESI